MRLFLLFLTLIILTSCSKLGLEKRRYRQGFYHDSYSQNKPDNKSITSIHNKKITTQTSTITVDTNLATIILPTTNTSINKISTKNNVFASTQKDKSNYLSNPYLRDKKTNPYSIEIRNIINAKRHDHYYGIDSWKAVLLLLIYLVILSLIDYGISTLFPMMSGYITLLISFSIITLLALLYFYLFIRKSKPNRKN